MSKNHDHPTRYDLPRSYLVCVFLLSASSLLFEINLTRLFSVSQFYHFAFMVVSLALLGYGISGALLQLRPKLAANLTGKTIGVLSTATGYFYLLAYLVINWLPFDSFSVMWDSKQVFRFTFHYLLLTTPFLLNGLVMGIMLSKYSASAGKVYSFNLTGAALGCALALVLPKIFGGEGMVGICCLLAILANFSLYFRRKKTTPGYRNIFCRYSLIPSALCILILFDLVLRLTTNQGLEMMSLAISPYKSLTYAQQYPDAKTLSKEWNAFSRVDVLSSSGIRSIPGLSFIYQEAPPSAKGILIDGDNLSPIIPMDSELNFTHYTMTAAGFQIHPNANVLILDSRGGLDVNIALNEGAEQVAAVEANPLIIQAVPEIYQHPQVSTIQQTGRSYLDQTQRQYDLIVLCLTDSFHPVSSGAYSLGEDYRHTVEAYQSAISTLEPDGVLLVTRWLQNPPSESLRSFSTAVSALEQQQLNPEERLFVFRSYNIATILIKREPFSTNEIQRLKTYTEERAFDLVYYPKMSSDEANRFSILETPIYHETFTHLIQTESKAAWISDYPFDIRPPTDNHPFFNHYFRFQQIPELITTLGKTWEPFGGAGFIVIFIILALVTLLSMVLIILPLAAKKVHFSDFSTNSLKPKPSIILLPLGYFGLIGLGYFFIEIPLIQQLILYLDHPSYAITIVLFSLLLFSGIGSQLSGKLKRPRRHFWWLPVTIILSQILIQTIIGKSLGIALWIRGSLAFFSLAPLGLLMGMPLPIGISVIEKKQAKIIPWVWSINGTASVIASILAMLFALFWGFAQVYWIGLGCYIGSWLLLKNLGGT